MSTCWVRRVGQYKGLWFCISSCAQTKRVVCSKCDDPNLHIISLGVRSMCG